MSKPRPEFLDLAIASGATLTWSTSVYDLGKSTKVVFDGEAWRAFDVACQQLSSQTALPEGYLPIPKSVHEAECMIKLGTAYLAGKNSEKLK